VWPFQDTQAKKPEAILLHNIVHTFRSDGKVASVNLQASLGHGQLEGLGNGFARRTGQPESDEVRCRHHTTGHCWCPAPSADSQRAAQQVGDGIDILRTGLEKTRHRDMWGVQLRDVTANVACHGSRCVTEQSTEILI